MLSNVKVFAEKNFLVLVTYFLLTVLLEYLGVIMPYH